MMEYNALIKKRKSCCCVFSLQTGVLLIVFLDLLVFMMIACITGMTVESFEYAEGLISEEIASIGFTSMTDGFCLLLFFIRLLFGLRYAHAVLFPPKMDYEYIIEFGKLKWHTKRVKNMRIYFKNYALAANVSSTFIFIQTLVLLLVLWNDTELYFRYCFLVILSLFTLVNLFTVYKHLEELDE